MGWKLAARFHEFSYLIRVDPASSPVSMGCIQSWLDTSQCSGTFREIETKPNSQVGHKSLFRATLLLPNRREAATPHESP